GRVPGRMHEGQSEPADREGRVIVDLHQIRAEALEELALRLVDVDLRLHALQQLFDAGNAAGHAPGFEAPADVILVSMGDERAGDRHALRLGGLDNRVDLPRWVDHHALAGLRVADEIDEILHRPQLLLLQIVRLVCLGYHRIPSPLTRLGRRYPSVSRTPSPAHV